MGHRSVKKNRLITADVLTPGPSSCSKRITFQHTFQLEKPEPQKKSEKVRKPKSKKPRVRQPRVPTKTAEEQREARCVYEQARRQKPERKEAMRLHAKKLREERKKTGQCRVCSNQAIPGQTRCEICRDKHRANRQLYDAKRREQAKKSVSTAPPGDQ